MTQKHLHIAVLDTKIFLDTLETSTGDVNLLKQSTQCGITHGTICYAIIQDYVKANKLNVTLSCVPVLDYNCKGSVDSLIDAIHWCEENHVDIINLSLGTRAYNEFTEISSQINEAYYKYGIIFVCAGNNGGKLSFPSYLTNVISVNTQPGLCKGYLASASPNELGIDITSFSEHLLHINNITVKTHANNSFAAPYVTVEVARLLSHTKCDRSIEDILFQLCHRNISCSMCGHVDWLYNAIIIDVNHDFPYNFSAIVLDSMDDCINFISQDTQAIIVIKDSTKNCNELDRLCIYKRVGNQFMPFTYVIHCIHKTKFLAMIEKKEYPIVISIVMNSVVNSEVLLDHVRTLLKSEQCRVYTITHNIRNLLNGEGFVTNGSIYAADLPIKLENSLIDIILLDECGYGEDLCIYISKESNSFTYKIVYNCFDEQSEVTISQECLYDSNFLSQLILDVFS